MLFILGTLKAVERQLCDLCEPNPERYRPRLQEQAAKRTLLRSECPRSLSSCTLQDESCELQCWHLQLEPFHPENASTIGGEITRSYGTRLAFGERSPPGNPEEVRMDLVIWLPALFLLGLLTMGLVFAFLAGCERI
jgi:hypothetical protein